MPTVVVAPYDPAWTTQFEEEAQRLTGILGKQVIITHHVGSTAVPDLAARPIIDILVEVRQIERMDEYEAILQALGYTSVGEHGIPGRRFFIKNEAEKGRTHNLFIFPVGHPGIRYLLDLRDYLTTHQREAEFYGLLKTELAQRYPDDLRSYMQEKDPFIQEILRRAVTWREDAGQGAEEKGGSDQET